MHPQCVYIILVAALSALVISKGLNQPLQYTQYLQTACIGLAHKHVCCSFTVATVVLVGDMWNNLASVIILNRPVQFVRSFL